MEAVCKNGEPNRRVLNKARTRAAIVQAATAIFAKKPYDETTIRDIAKASGYSTGAIFACFDGKAHLYEHIHGHPPVPVERGAHLLKIVRALALNGRLLSAEEPFRGALERLIVIAQGRVAEVWPEGLRSDVEGGYIAHPDAALENLAEELERYPEPSTKPTRPPVTAATLDTMADLLWDEEREIATLLRQRADRRVIDARKPAES